MSDRDLIDIQDQFDSRSEIRGEGLLRDNSQSNLSVTKSTVGLTSKNLKVFKAIEDSKQMQEFAAVLSALNLPENFVKLLEDIPEELQHYIFEEIIDDILSLNDLKIEKSVHEKSVSHKDKLLKALSRKRLETALDNLESIKKKGSRAPGSVYSSKLHRDTESQNKLYPLNMRDDDTKSHTFEMKLVKEKKEKQHKMLKEQIADEAYPKNRKAILQEKERDREEYAR
mmetsp:Transcript_41298/g.62887  ORF Transcript_41298/g.62887 Transcript_41298/m.62887 type:complete len:227 (-) Transcript_41298:1392-2072(-)